MFMKETWAVLGLALGLILAANILYAFAGNGAASPAIPSSNAPVVSPPDSAPVVGGVQKVSVKALGTGVYDHPRLVVKKGIPVELTFSAEPSAGCGHQFVMRDFGVNIVVSGSESKTVQFTPDKTGTFEYACGMRMFRGQLIVV